MSSFAHGSCASEAAIGAWTARGEGARGKGGSTSLVLQDPVRVKPGDGPASNRRPCVLRVGEAPPDRRRERSCERDAVPLDRSEDPVRQGGVLFGYDASAGQLHVPVDLDAGRGDSSPRGGHDLRSGPVAGNERHAVGHTGPPCSLDFLCSPAGR